MDLLTRFPWGTLFWGCATALAVGVAVIGFGAPGWILLPITWVELTVLSFTRTYVDRHTGRRGH